MCGWYVCLVSISVAVWLSVWQCALHFGTFYHSTCLVKLTHTRSHSDRPSSDPIVSLARAESHSGFCTGAVPTTRPTGFCLKKDGGTLPKNVEPLRYSNRSTLKGWFSSKVCRLIAFDPRSKVYTFLHISIVLEIFRVQPYAMRPEAYMHHLQMIYSVYFIKSMIARTHTQTHTQPE
jgi:hypothetical protein